MATPVSRFLKSGSTFTNHTNDLCVVYSLLGVRSVLLPEMAITAASDSVVFSGSIEDLRGYL